MSDTMRDGMRQDRDLVLPPQTFAFVLDSTKGKVSAYVGPYKNSLSNTDQLVVWDESQKRVRPTDSVEAAISTFVTAEEGQYIVLANPTSTTGAGAHPPKGNSSEAVDLEFGRRVIIAGPVSFPLWPGQTAKVIDGHHLRHNEYLLTRVYDEDQARENRSSAVLAPQTATSTGTEEEKGDGSKDAIAEIPVPVVSDAALTMGQLNVIKGTDVSFYMPSTGIEVVPDASGKFVRSAVTLETLEYCLLLDENGQKRYVRGPAVVFPSPTEKFVESKHGTGERVFRATELNENSGLYVKVIDAYTDEAGVFHPVGEELFITGKETAIYFPRAEESIITYGDQKKHYAVAIPAGEGRYVLDRDKGQVNLVQGPKMFLPDPRHEVVVRRILDPHDCEILYPGNEEALAVNAQYRQASDTVSAAEHLASGEMSTTMNFVANAVVTSAASYTTDAYSEEPRTRGRSLSKSLAGDPGLARSTSYQEPRTITLDTKYEGAVAISIWPGYAVLVTDRTGSRRVEIGPKVVQLAYDETVMTMELSTGRPKNDRNLLKTGYLRVANNVVSDIVRVETRDLVALDIEISYRVNFEGTTEEETLRWFEVENYVQVLTDHCRSRLRNVAKRSDIRTFYTDTIDITRDTLLGASTGDGPRDGLFFPENGMRVYDVEVLNVTIRDENVAALLGKAQSTALTGAIQLSIAEEEATRNAQLETLKRKSIQERDKTSQIENEINLGSIGRDLDERLAEVASELQVAQQKASITTVDLSIERQRREQQVELTKLGDAAAMERLTLETTEYVRRQEAMDPNLIAALQAFGEQDLVKKIVTTIGPAGFAAGVSTADVLDNLFKGTPMESVMSTLASRPLATAGSSNGSH